MADPSLIRFRAVVEGALAQLEARREEVNDLNVFPVADGDTGDNMALTLRAVLDELDRLSAQGDIDEIGRDEIVDSVARAALLGARGNSGVILSQLIRGAAEELISRPGELVDPVLIGAAMARAADRAYGSVREPAEGTILTVVREMAHRVASEIAHMEPAAAARAGPQERQDALIAEVLERALDAGQQSVQARPRPAPGAARGRRRRRRRLRPHDHLRRRDRRAARRRGRRSSSHHAPARVTHPEHESSTFRYCTNFAVTGEGLDPNDWIEALEAIGDSVLVVGDRATLKVHVHTDEPERATALFAGAGAVSRLDVADMHEQVAQRTERLAAADRALRRVAVVAGEGMEELFESRRRDAARRRPDAQPVDLRAARRHPRGARRGGRGAAELPERRDGRRARRRAVGEGRRRVVPTRSMQAGLAAAVALDPAAPPRTTPPRCSRRSPTCAPARSPAPRATTPRAPRRFHRGDAVGFVDERARRLGRRRPRRSRRCSPSWAARPSWSR